MGCLMPMTFRLAEPHDLPAILPLMAEYYAYDGHDFDEPAARAALAELLGDPRCGRAWLIEDDGKAIGYAVLTIGFSLEWRGRDGFVDEIFVKEAYRGKGLGRQALELLLAEARALGIRALHLEVDDDNARARAVYEGLGFKVRDRFRLMSRRV